MFDGSHFRRRIPNKDNIININNQSGEGKCGSLNKKAMIERSLLITIRNKKGELLIPLVAALFKAVNRFDQFATLIWQEGGDIRRNIHIHIFR